MEKAQRFTN
jgi:hypothetical protein